MIPPIEPVCPAVHAHGAKARVAEHDLPDGFCGGVSFEHRLQIALERFKHRFRVSFRGGERNSCPPETNKISATIIKTIAHRGSTLFGETRGLLPLKAVTQLLRPPVLGLQKSSAGVCRRRLPEGTSAALVQVGFQPVTDPLLEHSLRAYSFPVERLCGIVDNLVYGNPIDVSRCNVTFSPTHTCRQAQTQSRAMLPESCRIFKLFSPCAPCQISLSGR